MSVVTGLHRAGCSKSPSSKAAASEEAKRTFRYVELLSDARTKPAGFFSFLLRFFLPEEERSIQPGDGDGDEFNRQQQSAHDGFGCRWAKDEMQAEEFGSL